MILKQLRTLVASLPTEYDDQEVGLHLWNMDRNVVEFHNLENIVPITEIDDDTKKGETVLSLRMDGWPE